MYVVFEVQSIFNYFSKIIKNKLPTQDTQTGINIGSWCRWLEINFI